jgi:hypothetical protein
MNGKSVFAISAAGLRAKEEVTLVWQMILKAAQRRDSYQREWLHCVRRRLKVDGRFETCSKQ